MFTKYRLFVSVFEFMDSISLQSVEVIKAYMIIIMCKSAIIMQFFKIY